LYLSEEGLNVEVAILCAPSGGIASPEHCCILGLRMQHRHMFRMQLGSAMYLPKCTA
jgi:hypothetical protein